MATRYKLWEVSPDRTSGDPTFYPNKTQAIDAARSLSRKTPGERGRTTVQEVISAPMNKALFVEIANLGPWIEERGQYLSYVNGRLRARGGA